MRIRARHALLVAGIALAGVASGAQAIEPTPAEKRLAAAQRQLDVTAAQLARARSGLRGATPADRGPLLTRESRLARRKAVLTRRVSELSALALDSARAERDVWVVLDEAPPVDASEPSPAGDAGVVVGDGVVLHSTPGSGSGAASDTAPAGAAALDAYLAARTSPLAGLGPTFVAEASAVGLDPRLLVAITGAETSFGTYAPSQAIHNPFGLGPGRTYPSWAESIRTAARTLAGPIYLGDGRVTIPAIQARWAPFGVANDPTGLNNHWVRNVSTYYRELGGDPDAPVFSDTAVPVSALPAGPTIAGGPGARLATAAVRRLGEPARAEDSSGGGLSPTDLVREAASEEGIPLQGDLDDAGRPVPPVERRAGDVLFLTRPGTTRLHVGVYLGAGAFVHASTARGEVSLATLHESRFVGRLAKIRRLTP